MESKPLIIFGKPDDRTIAQIERCLNESPASKGILCGDAHLGYAQPVGGVVAYIDHVSVSGVGFDIACGNMAIKTDATWADIQNRLPDIADRMAREISFGVGSTSATPIDHDLFDDAAWSIPEIGTLKDLARIQLSSCGSGNHYCDVFIDEGGIVWVGVHFGSRGLGHKIATHFLRAAGGKDGMDVPPTVLHVQSSLGAEYLEGMRLAGLYAYAGREHVARFIVRDILGASAVEEIHNHHNFCWQETHDGQAYYVVRKGATPASPGERGFIGGSMGDISVIVRGVDSPASRNAMYSTVHGAGRVMSRTQAAGKSKWKRDANGKKVITKVTVGCVNETEMRDRIAGMGIELRGAGADEAPQVYRPLRDVLVYHDGTIEVESVLTPKVVVMAGADIDDPYKD